jgi:hypothetical protein
LGHVIRMDQIRVTKNIFESKPKVRRKLKRPNMRWPEDIEIGLQELNVKRWTQTTKIIYNNRRLSYMRTRFLQDR